MSFYEYAFEARIERLPIGNGPKVLHYHVVILPDDLIRTLPFSDFPKLRVIGEIGDSPVRGAWNPIADGRKYFILSQTFLDTAGLACGDRVDVRFNIDDQDYVEIPAELGKALAANADLDRKWNSLTAGKKRFYCHQISSAKQQSTRDKRLSSVLAQIG